MKKLAKKVKNFWKKQKDSQKSDDKKWHETDLGHIFSTSLYIIFNNLFKCEDSSVFLQEKFDEDVANLFKYLRNQQLSLNQLKQIFYFSRGQEGSFENFSVIDSIEYSICIFLGSDSISFVDPHSEIGSKKLKTWAGLIEKFVKTIEKAYIEKADLKHFIFTSSEFLNHKKDNITINIPGLCSDSSVNPIGELLASLLFTDKEFVQKVCKSREKVLNDIDIPHNPERLAKNPHPLKKDSLLLINLY